MKTPHDYKLDTLWTDDLIEAKVAEDIANYRRVFKGDFKWPIYPEEMALKLWGVNVEYHDKLADNNGHEALAYYDPHARVIHVGKNDNLGMLSFSLAHEVGHISLHDFLTSSRTAKQEWCYELRGEAGDKAIEQQANVYASVLLMPQDALAQKVNEMRGAEKLDMKLHALPLMKHFKVSRQALEIRLTGLGFIFNNGRYGGRARFEDVLDSLESERAETNWV